MNDRDLLASIPPDLRPKIAKTRQPAWFAPMLPTLTDDRFSRAGWLFEPKLDGERCLAFRRNGKLELLSRNQKLLNAKYPELVEAFEKQKHQRLIVDGEIVTFQDGVTSFSKLQQRMQTQHPSAVLRKKVPVKFYAFDLLYLDSYDLRRLPLRYRKLVLKNALRFHDPLCLAEYRETEGEAYYQEACKRRWEGIIAKNGDSEYISERTRQWLKFKCVLEQEFVIGGYSDPEGQRIGFGALLIGYYDHGKLRYAGKVGTGYDHVSLRRLGKNLASLETGSSPFAGDGLPRLRVHWVKPKLVAQVGFSEWTSEGKLRHPRFLGLRDDKNPEEVKREK